MKREQKCPPNPKPYKSHWFWKKCEECGMEFKAELGWKFLYHPDNWYYSAFSTYKYLCKECAPTQEKALKIFNDPLTSPPQGGSGLK